MGRGDDVPVLPPVGVLVAGDDPVQVALFPGLRPQQVIPVFRTRIRVTERDRMIGGIGVVFPEFFHERQRSSRPSLEPKSTGRDRAEGCEAEEAVRNGRIIIDRVILVLYNPQTVV